eukprot:scaffold154152_cov28-Tisochrysis_lutea.AAC.1
MIPKAYPNRNIRIVEECSARAEIQFDGNTLAIFVTHVFSSCVSFGLLRRSLQHGALSTGRWNIAEMEMVAQCPRNKDATSHMRCLAAPPSATSFDKATMKTAPPSCLC